MELLTNIVGNLHYANINKLLFFLKCYANN